RYDDSGDRGGFKRRGDSEERRDESRGGNRSGGDSGARGGYRDEPAGRSRPGERGGFRRYDDSGDRGGFKRRGDSEERRDESRGGNRSGGDYGARGGFRRGDSPRGESPRGGFDRRRDDSGDRGEARRGEAGERAGFKRRGDFDDRGDAGRRGESGFQRRDDDRRRQGSDRDGRRDDDREGSTSRGEDRRRGGEGARVGAGRSLDRRPPRPEEPDLPDEVQAADLDSAVRRDLLSLDKGNAETVARHLVMAVRLLDDDPGLALAHARAARQRAGRIAVVRETAGVVAYHAGEWAEALSELRTARRMSGGSGLLAVMADCERGLGRPERAIELGRSDEARALRGDEAAELRIVVAGARMDLGQYDQAVVTLQTSDLDPSRTGSAAARLFYAYADALVAAGRTDEGLTWFLNAASADLDGETDAEERAAELTGDSDI
ncbi:hypothetical protein ACWEPH_24470, partial [Nocardia beijingensis]